MPAQVLCEVRAETWVYTWPQNPDPLSTEPRLFTHGPRASNNPGTSTCQQAQAIRDRTQVPLCHTQEFRNQPPNLITLRPRDPPSGSKHRGDPSPHLTPITLSPGHTPLHVAIIHKDVEMVRLLRDAGADLDKPVSPNLGEGAVGGRGLIPSSGPLTFLLLPHRSPRAAGALCTWQWRPRRPMYWSFS